MYALGEKKTFDANDNSVSHSQHASIYKGKMCLIYVYNMQFFLFNKCGMLESNSTGKKITHEKKRRIKPHL